ncbi:hypothetical protein [Streptomyces sp. TRM64462]|uniref:hypothetical protein n=1 Tax=Streptomyces sp. TRM64462 TaxID=2741726 RepID=UPI001586954B|nr:hypothetical protein [Streptomyces sp. TRM64462]
MTHSRTFPVAVAAVVCLLAGWLIAAAPAAHAHGDGLRVEITGHAFGRVETTVTWADGDPVDGAVAATVNATAVGSDESDESLGPWRLVPVAGEATRYATVEALPPGRWRVVVGVGHPGLGRAERELTVSPGTPASPGPSAGPPPSPDPRPDPRPSLRSPRPSPEVAATPTASTEAPSTPWLLPAAVAAAVAVCLGAVAVLRRRRG